MNDVEHDLRELFERKASSMGGVAPRLPEPVRKRGRRRQLGTAFVSGLTALAVLAGTVGVIRAVDTGRDRQPAPADDPWVGYEVFERTATIDPFTITSGSDWYLVRLHERLCGSTKSCDLLQLTNFDPGLDGSVCDGEALPADGVALVVSVVPELRLVRLPVWPTTIENPVGDGRCGDGRYFIFQDDMKVTPYQAWIGRGIDADDQVVAQLLRSFQGMSLEQGPTPGRTVSLAITEDAAYVVAGGESGAGPWRLELTEASSGAPVLHLTTPEGDATASIPDRVPSSEPIWQKGGDPVFGAVTKEATGVELHLEGGTPPIPAQVVPLPPSLPFDYDLFFASNDSDVPATAVITGEGVAPSPPASPGPSNEGVLRVATGTTGDIDWTLEYVGGVQFALVDGQHDILEAISGNFFASLGPENPVIMGVYDFGNLDQPRYLLFGIARTDVAQLTVAIADDETETRRRDLPDDSTRLGDGSGSWAWWIELPPGPVSARVAAFDGGCHRLQAATLSLQADDPTLPDRPTCRAEA